MAFQSFLPHFLFLVSLLSFFISSSQANKFNVGGRQGWVLNPSENYNNWSQRNRFQVNDTLFFKYKKGSDSVLVVNKNDYETCNTKNPIQKLEDGDSEFKLDRSGPFYFISGKNCDKGQKLIVVVLAVRPRKGIPSPPGTFPAPGAHPPVASPPGTFPAPGAHPPVASPPGGSRPISPFPSPKPTPVPPPSSNPPATSPSFHAPIGSPALPPYSPSPTSKSPTGSPVPPPSSLTPSPTSETPSGSPVPSAISPTGSPVPSANSPIGSPVPSANSPTSSSATSPSPGTSGTSPPAPATPSPNQPTPTPGGPGSSPSPQGSSNQASPPIRNKSMALTPSSLMVSLFTGLVSVVLLSKN